MKMADQLPLAYWQQGSVLSDEAVNYLGLKGTEGSLYVVVSHDCDIACRADKEPHIEVIEGCPVAKISGQHSHGKNPRQLHLPITGPAGMTYLELKAPEKRPVDKTVLVEKFRPSAVHSIKSVDLRMLQRWLGARYFRAAFPDEFNHRLKQSSIKGSGNFIKRVETLLNASGGHVRYILFDLDEGEAVERQGPDDLYMLRVTLVYDSSKEPLAAAAQTQQLANDLTVLFDHQFRGPDGQWERIELLGCEAVSDGALTMLAKEMMQEWDWKHLSLDDDPPGTMEAV
jgi:hypothetical protein